MQYNHSIDAHDLAILRLLQRNNHMPQREIGAEINLSAPAVQRRIKRLEESGIIRENVAVLDPHKVGRPLTIIVEVKIERERSDLIDAVKARFTAAGEVLQCFYVTGEADFILVVSVESMAEYEALTRRLFFADENVRRFRTFVTMDRVKATTSLPI